MDVSAHDVFWSVPSKKEAMEAVSDLQMISLPTNGQSSSGLVRSQPGQPFPELSLLLSQAHHKLLDALHLLWTNQTFKNMVISLATDKAVWNAIMKNKMVQEFKSTYHPDLMLYRRTSESRELFVILIRRISTTTTTYIESIIPISPDCFDDYINTNASEESSLQPRELMLYHWHWLDYAAKSANIEKYLKHVELPPPSSQAQWSDAGPNLFAQILSLLCRIAKAVVIKFIDDIISLVHKLFDQHMSEFTMEIASELVKYAFMLSVLVFIIVILKRSTTSNA